MLWELIESTPPGLLVEWSESEVPESSRLGFTAHTLGQEHRLITLTEVSDANADLARRLHRQRLEAMGRLVTSVAHDLRAPLASIVYNLVALQTPDLDFEPGEIRQIATEMSASMSRLRATVDRLLELAAGVATCRRRLPSMKY